MSRFDLVSWLIVFTASFCDGFVLYVVKSRSAKIGPFTFSSLKTVKDYILLFASQPLVWVAVVVFVISLPMGYIAVSRLPLTQVYPVNIALHLVIALVIGVLLMHETISGRQMLGIGLIGVAAWLIIFK